MCLGENEKLNMNIELSFLLNLFQNVIKLRQKAVRRITQQKPKGHLWLKNVRYNFKSLEKMNYLVCRRTMVRYNNNVLGLLIIKLICNKTFKFFYIKILLFYCLFYYDFI